MQSAILAFNELLSPFRIPHKLSEVKGAGHVYTDILSGLGDEGFAFWRQAFSGLALGM